MKRYLIYIAASVVALFAACASSYQHQQIKVISYNLRLAGDHDGENTWERRKNATIQMIMSERPDLLGIQEGLIGQVKFIEQGCSDYARVGVGRDDGVEAGELMAIYYIRERFDLLNQGTFWLSATPNSVSRGWDAACNRVVTWGHFRDKQSQNEICFLNTHLDHMGERARAESIKLIVKKILELVPAGLPVVVGGDFNSTTDNDIFRPLDSLLLSARDRCPITDNKGTFTGFGRTEPSVQLDHLFFANAVPVSFRTLDGDYGAPYISDHYPIELVLNF